VYNEILRKGLKLNLYLEQQHWLCERKQYFNLEQQYIGSMKLQNNALNLTHSKVKSDHRSKCSNLSNWMEEA